MPVAVIRNLRQMYLTYVSILLVPPSFLCLLQFQSMRSRSLLQFSITFFWLSRIGCSHYWCKPRLVIPLFDDRLGLPRFPPLVDNETISVAASLGGTELPTLVEVYPQRNGYLLERWDGFVAWACICCFLIGRIILIPYYSTASYRYFVPRTSPITEKIAFRNRG